MISWLEGAADQPKGAYVIAFVDVVLGVGHYGILEGACAHSLSNERGYTIMQGQGTMKFGKDMWPHPISYTYLNCCEFLPNI